MPTPGAIAPIQTIFEGFQDFFKAPAWQPRPGTLLRVRKYFEGYFQNRRPIFGKREHIAKQLKIHVRTLARYLAYLKLEGVMEVVQRKSRNCIRRILKPLGNYIFPVPSFAPSADSVPYILRNSFTEPSSQQTQPPESRKNPKKSRNRSGAHGIMSELAIRLGIA